MSSRKSKISAFLDFSLYISMMLATIIPMFGTGKMNCWCMLSSSMEICMRLMVTSCLRATMLAKTSGSMLSVSRKFSQGVRVLIQHAIQKSIVTRGVKNYRFFKILTKSRDVRESGKIEIFRSQPLTSEHRAVLCGKFYKNPHKCWTVRWNIMKKIRVV